MASLNTLRTRGGIIVSVVITLALLAFLLQDLGSSGTLDGGGDRKVGEINGTKIDLMEYSNQIDNTSEVMRIGSGKDQLTSQEQESARTTAWSNLLVKYSFRPGMQRLGLTISEQEQVDMVSGVYISPVLGVFVDPATGVLNNEMLRGFMANMRSDATGRLALYWKSLEEQMNTERLMTKFFTLVSKGGYLTDLEVRYGVAEANDLYSGTFVSQPYTSVADSDVSITAAEIRKYYNDNQKMFKQATSRDVEYVVFDLLPSQLDMDGAKEQVDIIASEFIAAENPFQYATLNSGTRPDARYLKPSQMDASIAASLIDGGDNIYGPILNNDTYTMARLGEWKTLPDSLGIRQIVVSGGRSVADSLLGEIKSGRVTFDQALADNSIDPQAKDNGGDMGFITPGDDEFSTEALKVAQGGYFVMEQAPYSFILQVTKRTAAQRKVQVAQITYKVYPSDATQQEVYGQASRFLAAAGGSADNFQKAATEMALAKRVAHISDTDRTVNGMDNSSTLINWAFNNKKGAVSSILELNGNYLIASLTDVQQEGFAPLDRVTTEIESKLLTLKKGEMLAAKMGGGSVEAIAASLGASVHTFDNVQHTEFYLDNAGVEPKLIGAFSGVLPGAVSKPVKGNVGVYVFQVTDKGAAESAQTPQDVKVRMEAMQGYSTQNLIYTALESSSNIKDYRAKFY